MGEKYIPRQWIFYLKMSGAEDMFWEKSSKDSIGRYRKNWFQWDSGEINGWNSTMNSDWNDS